MKKELVWLFEPFDPLRLEVILEPRYLGPYLGHHHKGARVWIDLGTAKALKKLVGRFNTTSWKGILLYQLLMYLATDYLMME